MNPAIHYDRARERQANSLGDPRTKRLARRITDPRLPALDARLRDVLLLRGSVASRLLVAPQPR